MANSSRRKVRGIDVPEDLKRAHQALLNARYVSTEDAAYGVVEQWWEAVARWHEDHTGWSVERDTMAGLYRLIRRPAYVPTGISEPWLGRNAFNSARDYGFLMLLLWYARTPLILEKGVQRQISLKDLKTQLSTSSAREGENSIDFSGVRGEHGSLMHALRAMNDMDMVDLGIDVERFGDGVNDEEITDLLATFKPSSLAFASGVDLNAAETVPSLRPDSKSLVSPFLDEDLSVVKRIWRGLLLGPAIFSLDDPEALEKLADEDYADGLKLEMAGIFGYGLEVNRYYARTVRFANGEQLERTSTLFSPMNNSTGQAILLFCSELRRRTAQSGEEPGPWGLKVDRDGCLVMTHAEATELFRYVVARYGPYWAVSPQQLAETSPSRFLLTEIYPEMRKIGFMRGPDVSARVLFTPVAGLYSVTYKADGPEGAEEPSDVGKGGN